MRHDYIRLAVTAAAAALLAGCGAFGQGVARAIIETAERAPAPESGLCEITGPEFPGLSSGLEGAGAATTHTTRLVIVHGIGTQQPGHSERLQHNVARRLGLDAIDPTVKTINLLAPADAKSTPPGVPLGVLRISRYSNTAGGQLLTFELTWSELLDAERKAIAFDEFGVSARTRADVNTSIKGLINNFTDPLAYNGSRGDFIRGSMLQALCWVGRGEWADYPTTARAACSWRDTLRNVIQRDEILISSHSLGSRIALDSLAVLGTLGDALGPDIGARTGLQALDSMRDKNVTLFMLANQLPLLQMGQPAPMVAKQPQQYCGPDAPKIKQRWFKRLSIVAFSDPNDILSYTIPQSFSADFMDSRLCAATTNVVVSVARSLSIVGTSIASPQMAHTAYDNDERVLSLMTRGLGDRPPPTGCTWLKYRGSD